MTPWRSAARPWAPKFWRTWSSSRCSTAASPALKGKRVALFGSYGWGGGEWMHNWERDCRSSGIQLACDSVICNDAPDDAALAACQALGKALVD